MLPLHFFYASIKKEHTFTIPKRSGMKSVFIILVLGLLWVPNANAATINANSCSQVDVQTAINSAKTGDTVVIPAGKCTWPTINSYTGSVSIPSNNKITVFGAGTDTTTITVNPAGIGIKTFQTGSRITGINFVNGSVVVDGDGWRVDHCKFQSDIFDVGVHVYGERANLHPTGVIDNNTFINMRVFVTGSTTQPSHVLSAQPTNLGSADNVAYIEANTFTFTVFGNAIDMSYGGRYVFRYNTLNDGYVEAHSIMGNWRSSKKWEIYNNRINQVSRAMTWPMSLRGGTGVVFNNTITGTWGNEIFRLDNTRICDTYATSGTCDGSSPWDGSGPGGYPCRDQIGRATDESLWQAGNLYPPQLLEPVYAWNNKLGIKDILFVVNGGSTACTALNAAHIQENRDYYNKTPKPGYTPYTYPHPLARPSSPKNLRVVN